MKDGIKAIISERGNGFADPGEFTAGTDGNVYRILSTGRIHTGQPGESNYMYATVTLASWEDVTDETEPYTRCELEEDEAS